jgi:hypothetical protein
VINYEMIFLGRAKRSPLGKTLQETIFSANSSSDRIPQAFASVFGTHSRQRRRQKGGRNRFEPRTYSATPSFRATFWHAHSYIRRWVQAQTDYEQVSPEWTHAAFVTIKCPVTFFTINRPQRTGKLAKHTTYHTLIPPLWLLEELSELLAISLQCLHETTYLPELTHMYKLSKLPHPTLLNSSYFFHFCPECARNHLLRRVLMLAHITCCPLHVLALCQRCPCGTLQRLFCRQAQPFTCHHCGLDWAHFPQVSVSPEEVALSNELLKWYEIFFARGTLMLFSCALKLIRRRFPEKGAGGVRLLDGKTRFALPDGRSPISLGHLVDWLVSLHLSPSDLTGEIP